MRSLPSEKRISRLKKKSVPLDTKQYLKEFEKFLETDPNLSAAVSLIHLFR